tara:strand:- start:426 stop:836 length:411 start_codon:yes stop_codon:yes gene_type:complete
LGRILALDVGSRRIGVSMSDPMQIIASPFSVIDCKISKDVFSEIIDIIDDYSIDSLVIGMPITMKGKDSIQTKEVKQFIDKISKLINIEVYTVDERLSSVSAEKELIKSGVKTGHNKGEIDKTAATLILQEFLASK